VVAGKDRGSCVFVGPSREVTAREPGGSGVRRQGEAGLVPLRCVRGVERNGAQELLADTKTGGGGKR